MSRMKTMAVGLAALLLGGIGVRLAAGSAEPYTRIGMDAYQNFLTNWDDRAEPVRYALIRTPAEYDQLYQPAAIGGDRRPFHPPAELYRDSQILVVARVLRMPPSALDPAKADAIFEVEGLTAEAGALTLRYRLNRPRAADDAASFKVVLALRVPRAAYRTVTIIEDGKPVGRLAPAEGRWAVPTPK